MPGKPQTNLIQLTQQIPHLQLHILNQLSNIRDMCLISLDRHIRLDLSSHVARKIQTTQHIALCAEVQDDGGSELVLCGAPALGGFEHVDAVPGAGCGCGLRGGLFE